MKLLPSLLAWIMIYAFDNFLTIQAAKHFRNPPLADIYNFEGSPELNPIFIPEVDRLQLFGPRFRALLLASSIYLGFIWYSSELGLTSPDLFSFIFGGLFLLEAAMIIRHLHNAAIICAARAGILARGTVYTPRVLSYIVSSAHFMAFAALFLFLAILARSRLILGGSLGCGIYSLSNLWQARAAAKA